MLIRQQHLVYLKCFDLWILQWSSNLDFISFIPVMTDAPLCICHNLNEVHINSFTFWFTFLFTDWLIFLFTDFLIYWPTDRPTDRLTYLLTYLFLCAHSLAYLLPNLNWTNTKLLCSLSWTKYKLSNSTNLKYSIPQVVDREPNKTQWINVLPIPRWMAVYLIHVQNWFLLYWFFSLLINALLF